MADGLAKTLAGVLGFGLCKTALGVAYLTAMGSVFSNVGFISELSFMTPMLVASLATASLIVLGARRGRLSPGSLKQYPAVLALSLGFLFGGANLLPGLPEDALALVCGLLCGFSSTVLNIVWLDVLSAERDVAAPTTRSSVPSSSSASSFPWQSISIAFGPLGRRSWQRASRPCCSPTRSVVWSFLRGAFLRPLIRQSDAIWLSRTFAYLSLWGSSVFCIPPCSARNRSIWSAM